MKETILNTIEDLVSNFVYYDRKEDEDLSAKDLKEAVKTGVITVEEIINKFAEGIKSNFGVKEIETIKVVELEKTLKDKALDWWNNLSNIESIGFERKYGYYGHDQGVTEDEVIYMYENERVVE